MTVPRHLQWLRRRSQGRFELRLAVLVFVLLARAQLVLVAHAQVPAQAARYRAELVRAAHSQWGLDAPVAALAAQVHQESGWRPDAVSHVGARGMAQFMPATATWWCALNGLGAAACQPHNPTWALRALVAGSPPLVCDDDDQCSVMATARDDLLLRLCGTSMLRRAIIVGCAMLAMGLGA